MCEDWTMIVHSPKARASQDDHTQATLMDVAEVTRSGSTTTYTSVVGELKDEGAKLFIPQPVTNSCSLGR